MTYRSLTGLNIDQTMWQPDVDAQVLQKYTTEDLLATRSDPSWEMPVNLPSALSVRVMSPTPALLEMMGPLAQHMSNSLLYFLIAPNTSVGIHADGGYISLDAVSVSIPMTNCTTDTVTKFWDFPDGRPIEYFPEEIDGARRIVGEDDLEVIESYSMTTDPILIRNGYPHSVENNCASPRTFLSWRFKNTIGWDDALWLCEQYGLV